MIDGEGPPDVITGHHEMLVVCEGVDDVLDARRQVFRLAERLGMDFTRFVWPIEE